MPVSSSFPGEIWLRYPIFGRFYGTGDYHLEDMLDWFQEDLHHYGPVAIPYLKKTASKDTGGEWAYGPGLSGSILTRIATYYPETRDEITAFFRSLFAFFGRNSFFDRANWSSRKFCNRIRPIG